MCVREEGTDTIDFLKNVSMVIADISLVTLIVLEVFDVLATSVYEREQNNKKPKKVRRQRS